MSPLFNIRHTTARPSALSYFVVRVIAATALASISVVAAPILLAQSDDSQQSSQDVAEAARQARARKQQNAARARVYTNEDLRRGKILTPEDRSRAEAANHKNSSAPTPAAPAGTQALDTNSATPQEPLGDVARRYRNAKKISPFRLPANQPALAAPKILAPLVEPNSPLQPHPKNFIPARPVAPLSRGAVPNAPSLPSSHMGRINPFIGRRTQPAPPAVMTIRPVEPRVTPQPRSFTTPLSHSPATAILIVVRPGDTLWTLSRQHLGRGTRWLELLAANPAVEDPNRLVPGTQLTLPTRTTSHRHSAETITVQAGDSLSKLALAAYGHASYWPCLASANPSLTNPHQLHIGQSISVPASCTP